ncbi:MAG: T9SS type A sorting domain-containing protein [Candidatus Cloacimonetes bacterium]|nr:T9SS type A sorting domain-containing protein [Candidatus Cloacimonadota bacterium]
MKKLFLCFVFITILLTSLLAESMVISIPFVSRERVQEYFERGYDIAQVLPHENEVHIVVNEELKRYFESKYTNVSVLFTESDMRENLVSTYRSIPGYRTYNQMINQLFALQDEYPNMVKITALGPSQGKLYFDAGNTNYSAFNYTIYSVKMSNNVAVYQDKPNYFFSGAIHAREPISAEIVMSIIEDLIDTYSTTNDEHPLNQSQIWFVPVLNPDGHHVVISQMSTMHRKTIFDNNNNGQLDLDTWGSGNSIDGIDMNRNYDLHWGTTGISWSFNTQTYPGTHPFSSIEAAYMRDLTEEIPFVAGFTYHTHGHLVLWPYGYAYGGNSHNQATISSLGIELANLMPRYNNPNLKYTPQPSWELYPASGTSEDYYHFKHNMLAFTVELAGQFIPPAAEVEFHKANQLPAAYHLMSRHKNRFLTGLVTDYLTGMPVQAEIKVLPLEAFNPERATIFSDLAFGRYNYPLMPGAYQLSIRAEGYYPFFTDFTIVSSAQTVVNVELMPAEPININLILTHSTIPNLFNQRPVVLQHIITETLTTNSSGELLLNNLSPGEMVVLASGTDNRTYMTSIDLSETLFNRNTFIESQNIYDITIIFDDFTFIDEFTSFTGVWNATNWSITSNDYFSGGTSATAPSFVNNAALRTINPIEIPAGEKTYVNFMARYGTTMQSPIFIEFDISENGTNWTTIKQIRNTSNWENFNFVIPENHFNQIYFRFRVARYASASVSQFYLDLFSVNVGQATIIQPIFNPPQFLHGDFDDNVLTLTWDAPEPGSDGTFYEYLVHKNNTVIHNTTETTYTDNNVKKWDIYNYYITAVYQNLNGASAPSNVFTLNLQIPPEPVVLINPIDIANNVDINPVFAWEFIEDYDSIDTELWGLKFFIATTDTPSNNLLSNSLTSKNDYLTEDDISQIEHQQTFVSYQNISDFILIPINENEFMLDEDLEYDTQYAWSVVAFNPFGDSEYNQIFTFTTQKYPEPPNPVSLLTPNDKEMDVDVTVIFSWNLPAEGNKIKGLRFYITTDESVWGPEILYSKLLDAETTEHSLDYELDYDTLYFWRVIAYNDFGDSTENEVFSFTTKDYSSEGDQLDLPLYTELLGNFPNPFNPETIINFNLAEAETVTIEIYNIRGQKVKSLLNTSMDRGFHSVIWNGTDDNARSVGSGMYFYVMRAGEFSAVRRMVLLK